MTKADKTPLRSKAQRTKVCRDGKHSLPRNTLPLAWVEVDDSNEHFNNKICLHTKQKAPFMFVVGDKENEFRLNGGINGSLWDDFFIHNMKNIFGLLKPVALQIIRQSYLPVV